MDAHQNQEILDHECKGGDENQEDKLNFDNVLKIVGDKGRFQALLYAFFFIMEAAAGAVIYSFVFDSINPGIQCLEPGVTGNYTNDSVANFIDVCQSDGNTCANFSYIGDRKTIITQFGLICGRAYSIKLLQTIGYFGVFCGAPVAQLSDFYGRKKMLSISWLGLMVFGVCQRFALNLPMYTVLRFVACFFGGAQLALTTCYALEFFGPMWRSIVGNRIGFQIGELILDLCAYLLMDWRDCAVAISLFSVPFYPLFLYLMPESPRWLIQKGYMSELQTSLKSIARMNKRPLPSDKLLQKIRGKNQESDVKFNFLHLYSTKVICKKTTIFQFCGYALGCMGAGIASQMTNLPGSVYITYATSKAITIATRWAVIFLINYFGVKKTYIGTWIFISVLLGIVLGLDFSGIFDNNRIVVSYIVAVTDSISNFAWSSFIVLGGELFPTLLRNVGMAAGQIASRIGTMVGPQIVALEFLHGSAPFVVYVVQGIISLILLGIFIDDTHNQPLSDKLPPAKLKCCACLGNRKSLQKYEEENADSFMLET